MGMLGCFSRVILEGLVGSASMRGGVVIRSRLISIHPGVNGVEVLVMHNDRVVLEVRHGELLNSSQLLIRIELEDKVRVPGLGFGAVGLDIHHITYMEGENGDRFTISGGIF